MTQPHQTTAPDLSFTDLLRKYNVAGPRYTSYPTVPYWDTNPTPEQWISSIDTALRDAEKAHVGAAIYVHIPFCRSLCTYCGCNTRVTRNRNVVCGYIQSLLRELDFYLERLGRQAQGSSAIPLTELHFGGGTPTFLDPSELETLIQGIFSRVQVTPGHEFSIETNPRVTTREHLSTLARLGFHRLSLGVQDFDPKVQATVQRIVSEEKVREITEIARELDFTGINYDLIYGLPNQTEKSVECTIDAVRRLHPDRIAFYGYAHVPWIKPSHRSFTEADIPSGDKKRALYELGRKMLTEVGYREVGMDHFALETDSLWKAYQEKTLHRNFMGYTARAVSPLIGLGVSSIGDSWTAFAQNEKILESYLSRIDKGELPILRGHCLTEEDQVIRRHILNLMTRYETSWEEPALRTQYLEFVPRRLEEPLKDGLVEIRNSTCRITEKGRPFLRNICMAFDARLAHKAPGSQVFSQTI